MNYEQMGKFLFAILIKKYNLNDDKIINLSAYLTKRDVLNDDTISFLMDVINSLPLFRREMVIEYLCELYKKSSEDDNKTAKFLNVSSLSEICELFNTNYYFRKELFDNFFVAIKNNSWNLELENNQKQDIKVEMLPDMIRKAYKYVCNKLYESNYITDDVSEDVFFCLTGKKQITLADERFNKCLKFLKGNQPAFLRIMFADVLLYLEDNKDETFFDAFEYIMSCFLNDEFCYSKDICITLDIFDCFLNAVSSDKERIETKKAASQKYKNLYNEINPFNMIEDFGVARG